MDTNELSDVLRQEWLKRRRSPNETGIFDMLACAYSEAQRHYHNLQHVADMLAALPECSNALYMAVWFHDAVYDPQKHDNEEKSAELAEKKCIEMRYDKGFAADVASLIMATKHTAEPSTEEAKLICDADLAIFASPRVYEYDRAIRQEYSFVPEGAYLQRRKKVLEGFLARQFIYHTDKFREKYEQKARANLKMLIEELDSQLLELDTSTVNLGPKD
ncbi:MAG TPA: N-methyl-D-aspartate receptor NMDAR2C subunit [Nanoarchaeota archaeon]|nr:N-methyl-D-aspartate receptor NMDAR2C subunit [Nanoarchaeota archaeon]